MKIVDTRVYTGRNIYSHKLCIKLTVDVEDKYDTPTMDIKGFNERLLKALPNLKTHKCALGYEGGFVERLNTGTYLPHVFEHMIIEMQNALGFKNIKYGKARCVDKSIYNVIYQYDVREAGILCAKYALECINTIISGNDYPMDDAMENIEKGISDIRLGPSTLGIYNEALKRGIPVLKIGNQSILQLGYGKMQRRIEATLTDSTSCIAVDIACDKELTREALKTAGIPVAEGETVDNAEEVAEVCQRIGYPVVIKPLNGNQGKGVTVGIEDDVTALWAYEVAAKINKSVLIEKFIEGQDYRVLVLNKKVVAVSLRMPPRVVGNGEHNILELIQKENENPLRGYDHEKPLTRISIDDITINYLKSKGLELDYIPEKGEKITLRFNANLSTGGVAKDCTDIIHPDNMEIIIRAAEAVGLDIAGVDICAKDISKPLKETGGVVIEVNAAPGIRMHMYPTYGKTRNAAAYIVDYLFPNKENYSIPVISVTGTNGKTTTTRMIAHILSLKGLCVGMTTTCGVYVNNKLISKGDNTGPDSARCVLMDKSVEAAVLETARGGIIRRGLGYDLADVGVITNISGDHLGIDGIETMEDLANVKSLVAEAVKDYGYVVLNADDPSVNIINQRIKSNIIYFSKNPDNIILKKHLQDQGLAVFLKDNFICFGDGEKVQPIVNVSDIPSTMDGKLEYNIENAMAAAAGCIGLKEDIEVIAKGLKTFFLDEIQNPGRFNVYSVDNFKVVVDYGHNIGGYNAVIDGLKKLDAKRLVGVIAAPGDRRDDNITELGRISGNQFDYVYIKEDKDRRGRKEGETAAILEMGVLSAGMGSNSYRVILDEGDALQAAMENAEDGDCIVIFYEDYDYVISTITNFKNCQKVQDVKINAV
ncbi:MAG: cphA [Clostridiales bacterium]|nr:cphA [Clostridiales bacterium]